MQIIILSTCDEWRSWSSMRTYWVGTNINKFFQAVRKGIADGTFTYKNEELTRKEQLEKFDEDKKKCKTYLWDSLFNEQNINYGHVQLIENNSYT